MKLAETRKQEWMDECAKAIFASHSGDIEALDKKRKAKVAEIYDAWYNAYITPHQNLTVASMLHTRNQSDFVMHAPDGQTVTSFHFPERSGNNASRGEFVEPNVAKQNYVRLGTTTQIVATDLNKPLIYTRGSEYPKLITGGSVPYQDLCIPISQQAFKDLAAIDSETAALYQAIHAKLTTVYNALLSVSTVIQLQTKYPGIYTHMPPSMRSRVNQASVPRPKAAPKAPAEQVEVDAEQAAAIDSALLVSSFVGQA